MNSSPKGAIFTVTDANTPAFEFTKLPQRAILSHFEGASFARFLVQLQTKTRRPILVITDDTKATELLSDHLHFFGGTIQPMPAYDVLPYHNLSPHPQTIRQNMQALHDLIHHPQKIFITTPPQFLKRHMPRKLYDNWTLRLTPGSLIDRDETILALSSMGYEKSTLVEDEGQFAVRGDILDVFSPQMKNPVRISLFDIEVESLKSFDPASQQTQAELPSFSIIPVHEIALQNMLLESPHELVEKNWESLFKKRCDQVSLPKERRDHAGELIRNGIRFHGIETLLPIIYKKTSSLFDYLPPNTILVTALSTPFSDRVATHLKELETFQARCENIEKMVLVNDLFLNPDELKEKMQSFTCLSLPESLDLTASQDFTVLKSNCDSNQIIRTSIQSSIAKIHSLAPLASEINDKRLKGYTCLVACQSTSQQERVRDLLGRFELPLKMHAEDELNTALESLENKSLDERLVHLVIGPLHEGFLDHASKCWWISDEEVFGKKLKRVKNSRQRSTVFSTFSEMTEGDFIIHMDHGIGLYRGLIKLPFDLNKNDFLMIEYLGGDKLYVPVDRLNRVQRYVAEEGSTPMLDKLGGLTWGKVRQKAKRAARKMAAELLKMQALREAQQGYAFEAHHNEMQEFSTHFEFEETTDQNDTIEAVLNDMRSDKPMDRLICGDVGFGKTEVAIRAAYKAILDHKQVAVLVPTTVLAFQHFATFYKRLKDYAIHVEFLSRFKSAAEQKEILKKLKDGKIDVVIGTHRLLSEDVKFCDLGLLVIDEEHRFGVIHKEKIKKLKNLVDVITLTATPIPRTLNFALNGIRDLSLITTPPVDRLAIKTYICGFDEITLRDAMLKELKRGGQIFFVHNRVLSIQKVAEKISKLMPEARVRFAHGQMEADALENIMIAFMNHEFDILVCTTIIESGLDIPNANTMIINRADMLGLAQLYQLRGRVGRSYHQAYCYLVVPESELVTTKAKKRLAALQKFTELGSGFKIASHDLEIRGAGNILGDEQWGHIAAIGYDMYIHLLKEAIHELKNENTPEDFETELSLNIPAKIPEDFIPDTQLRLMLYKELSSSENPEEVETLRLEWLDRFGKLPQEILNLMALIKLRIACKKILISTLKASGDKFFVSFHPHHKIDTQILTDSIKQNPKQFSLSRDGQFVIQHKFETPEKMFGFFERFLSALSEV